jgi:flagellin
MPLSINTNIASLTAQRAMLNSNSALETSYERLSTGKRINSATDDAAGLAIGKDLESRVSGLNQAIRNVNDGISMVQIAEGALDEVTSILQRMRDLGVQGSNGSLSSTELGYLDTEQDKLATALGSVLDQATFGSIDLFADSTATSVTVQSGADAGETTSISVGAMSESFLGLTAAKVDMTSAAGTKESFTLAISNTQVNANSSMTLTLDGVAFTVDTSSATNTATLKTAIEATEGLKDLVTVASSDDTNVVLTHVHSGDRQGTNSIVFGATTIDETSNATNGVANASGLISMVDDALRVVATERATLGATQAQLESTVRNLANVAENTSAAAGRIMDTDYAAETANLTKAQILQQAATSVLAQANAQPQSVLSLLQ